MTRDALAGLDDDGCGILHYPSGSVLAIVSRVNGGKYTQFFDDTDTTSKQVQLLAAFNFAGIGFANFRSGAHRVVTTKTGVLVLNEDGSMARDHAWDKTSSDTPLPSPIEFNLNAILSFRCRSQSTIQITLQRGRHFVFEVGLVKSRNDTYLDKVLHRNVNGSLVLDIHSPTLVQRQLALQAASPAKKGQRNSLSPPRQSSRGRDAERVHLQAVMDANTALVTRLNSFSTSITANVAAECQRQRAIPSHSLYSPISKPCLVPPAKVKRPIVVPKHLPRLDPKHLDKFLTTVKSTQLVIVLCSNLSTSDCIAAEKMLAKFEHEWAIEDKQLATAKLPPVVIPVVPDPIPEPVPTTATTKGAAGKAPPSKSTFSKATNASKSTAATPVAPVTTPVPPPEVATPPPLEAGSLATSKPDTIDPAPERSQSSKRIVLVDCSTSTLLARRHNFSVYPMYLMYYGGQLGFCSNVFNGFGRTDVDFLLQVKTTVRNCQRNSFLPADFRFP